MSGIRAFYARGASHSAAATVSNYYLNVLRWKRVIGYKIVVMYNRVFTLIVIWLLGCVWPSLVSAVSLPVIPEREIWLDMAGDATLESVRALPEDAWQVLVFGAGNLGFVDGAVWLRMALRNAKHDDMCRWVLEVPFSRMDYIDWYVVRGGEVLQEAHSGSMRRAAEGAFDTRFPALPFGLGVGEESEIYVRIKTETVVHTRFRVWPEDVYAVAGQKRESAATFRMGAMFALILLSYFLVWAFRDMASVWISLCFSFFGVGMANLAGFWPQFDWLSPYFRVKILLLICMYGCVACLLLYVRAFHELKHRRPVLGRILFGIALAFFSMILLLAWLPYRPMLRAAHLAIFLAFMVTFVISVAMHAGRLSSWLNLGGHALFFGYIFTSLAFDLGWIPLVLHPDRGGFVVHGMAMLLFILAQVSKVRELDAAYSLARLAGEREHEQRLEDQRVMLRDLHDGLGGMAATISMMSAYGKRSADVAIKNERFGAIERMAGYAGAEIRSMMNALQQPAPLWAAWLADLHDYAKSVLGASQISLVWDCRGEHPEKWWGFAPALSLMRVVKEAVRNVVRHAGASRVQIGLCFEDDRLTILVRDNGHGFAPDGKASGRGLQNMRKRMAELGGAFDVDSTEGGTEIRVAVGIRG